VLLQQGERINCALTGHIDAVMQVGRRTARIPGIAHESDDIAGQNKISGLELTKSVQVRVVVHLSARTKNPDYIATEFVLPHSNDETAGGG
jgi:hypothetical protein